MIFSIGSHFWVSFFVYWTVPMSCSSCYTSFPSSSFQCVLYGVLYDALLFNLKVDPPFLLESDFCHFNPISLLYMTVSVCRGKAQSLIFATSLINENSASSIASINLKRLVKTLIESTSHLGKLLLITVWADLIWQSISQLVHN